MTITPSEGSFFKIVPNVKSIKRTDSLSDDGCVDEGDVSEPLCCLEGCLTGVVVAVLFLIVIPAGVILSIYAYNSDSDSILVVGVVLIVTPVVSVPIFIAIALNRRRLRKFRKNQVGSLKDTIPEKF